MGKLMASLPPSIKVMIFAGVVLFTYFFLVPMVNDDSCKALTESRLGFLNRITFQLIAGCWMPWD